MDKETQNSRPNLRLVHSLPEVGTFGARTNTPPDLIEGVVDMFASEYRETPRPMNPVEMVERVNQYAEIKRIANEDLGEEEYDIEWSSIARDYEIYFDDASECLKFIQTIGKVISRYELDGFEIWGEWLRKNLQGTHILDIPLTDRQLNKLEEFLANPTNDRLIARHPINKRISGFAEKVRRQVKLQQKAIAQGFLGSNKEPHVYWGYVQCIPDQLREASTNPNERYKNLFLIGQQEIWSYFEPCDESELSGEAAYLYRYSAVWVDVNSLGIATLVASATGYFIPLSIGGYYLEEHGFFDVCDCNGLEDIFSEVVSKFLPSEGLSSVEEFHQLAAEHEGMGPGIAYVTLHFKKPPFVYGRQANIIEDFLASLSCVMQEGSGLSYANQKHHRPPHDELEEITDEHLDIWEQQFDAIGPAQSPIRLFIVPVSGGNTHDKAENKERDEDQMKYDRYRWARKLRDCHPDGDWGFFVRPY